MPMFRKSTTLPSKNAVYPIRGATCNKEDKSELRRSRVLPSEGQPQQRHQRDPCRDREDGISRDGRQVGPKTQKPANILDVADAYRVRQERPIRSAGEIRRSGVLGYPVSTGLFRGRRRSEGVLGPSLYCQSYPSVRPTSPFRGGSSSFGGTGVCPGQDMSFGRRSVHTAAVMDLKNGSTVLPNSLISRKVRTPGDTDTREPALFRSCWRD